MNEIPKRHEKARKLMEAKGLNVLILGANDNLQYLMGVTEPSIHTCGIAIIPQQGQPVLAVMWLDKEAVKDHIEEIDVQTYTPDDEGAVIARIVEQMGITKGTIGMDDRALGVLESSLKKSLPQMNLVNASNAVDELKWIKSEEEIHMIQKACEIADQGMRIAIESLKPGMTELQVATLLENRMMSLGSDQLKHRTIVASGPRTGLIHPMATHKKILKGEVVALDFGAVYQGYCSDIARTFVAGKPSEELKKGFNAMYNAQEAIFWKLRPGISIREIENIGQKTIEEVGYNLVGHVGHNIGLKIEEHPRLRTARNPYQFAVIEKNMVLAFFQSSIQSDHCLGIRLEDTVIVTDSGARMLTSYARELFS